MLRANVASLTTAAAEVAVVRNLQQPLGDSRAADLVVAVAWVCGCPCVCVNECMHMRVLYAYVYVYVYVCVRVWTCAYMQWVDVCEHAVGADTIDSSTHLVKLEEDQLHMVGHAVTRGVQQLSAAATALAGNTVGTATITVGVIKDHRYCRQSARRWPNIINTANTKYTEVCHI